MEKEGGRRQRDRAKRLARARGREGRVVMGQRREQWSSVEKQEALLFHGCRRRWLPTVSGEDVVRVEEEREEKGRESEQTRRKTKKVSLS